MQRLKTVLADFSPVLLGDLSAFGFEKWRTAKLKAGAAPETLASRDVPRGASAQWTGSCGGPSLDT